jgi:tetratricopeptide (TPR) repeat protein
MRGLMSLLMFWGFALNSYAAVQQYNAKDEAVIQDLLRRTNPNVVEAFRQGTERMKAKDYSAAVAQFQKVLNDAPSFDVAYRRLATCFALMGNTEEAIKTMQKAVDLSRTHENLSTLAGFEALPGVGKTATPEANQRALRLLAEANLLKSDVSVLFLTASLAMQLKAHEEFRKATLQMMKDFPDKAESHYLNAVLAASNSEWNIAEEEIRRAGDLGLQPNLVREFLDSGVHRRANEWRYATYVGYAAICWAVGLALLFVFGKALSMLTLKSIERTAGSKTTGEFNGSRTPKSLSCPDSGSQAGITTSLFPLSPSC